MYIWLFSRSEGAGRATQRNTRGLTRSVMARMVPPLPAPSRPSNTMITRRPLCLTHSWSLQSSAWSRPSSFSYFWRLSFLSACWLLVIGFLLACSFEQFDEEVLGAMPCHDRGEFVSGF